MDLTVQQGRVSTFLNHNCRILWLHDITQVLTSPDVWSQALLMSKKDNLFLTLEWLSTWWKHFGEDKKSLLLILKEGDDVIAIAPLMYSKYRKNFLEIGLIQFMGTWLSDYGDFILVKDEEKCLNLIFEFLENCRIQWNVMDLRGFPEESSTIGLLQKVAKERGYPLIMKECSCQSISLNHSWNDYWNQLRVPMRRQVRRDLKNAMKAHSVDIVFDQNLHESIRFFFETYTKWLAQRKGQSTLFDIPFERVRKFLTDFILVSAERGWLDMSSLRLDHVPVSSYLGFIYDKTYYLYMSSWDPSYSHYGIGHIHLMNLIRRSINLGLYRFDFLRGDDYYKARWNTSKTRSRRIIIFNKNFKGKLANLILKMIE